VSVSVLRLVSEVPPQPRGGLCAKVPHLRLLFMILEPRISLQLPLWGQDPTGRGSAAQSVKTAAHVPFTFIRGGLLGLGYLSAARARARARQNELIR